MPLPPHIPQAVQTLEAPCVPYLGSLLSVLERTRVQGRNMRDAGAHRELLQAQHALVQRILDKRGRPGEAARHWGHLDAAFQRFLLEGLPERYRSADRHAHNHTEARLYALSLALEPRPHVLQA